MFQRKDPIAVTEDKQDPPIERDPAIQKKMRAYARLERMYAAKREKLKKAKLLGKDAKDFERMERLFGPTLDAKQAMPLTGKAALAKIRERK